jgi:recombination protein RecR
MEPLQELIKALGRLPGVGRRSAERMAVFLARDPQGAGRPVLQSLIRVIEEVAMCGRCGALTTRNENPCLRCTDPRRDEGQLCVVEDPGDIEVMERSRAFNGRYFALLGKISPQQEETVPRERLAALKARIGEEGIREVMLALNADVESDATASYILEALSELPVTLTRLGFGIPVGSGIAWSDPVTLSRAVSGRQPLGGAPPRK